ncbi:MAG TPA: HPP family protein [Janthinobacterium sp.]|nr:HPP family protein [Janthinobacterium sp.]
MPPRHTLRQAAVACGGIFLAIGALAFASFKLGTLLALGSFGSSSVLLFTFPESHFSQPRSILGGHVISSAVGLALLQVCGPAWWSLGLAVALAAAAMMWSGTLHPPAGSNPIIIFLARPGWGFLLFPTLFGALALVLAALAWHRLQRQPYPLYWRGAAPGPMRPAPRRGRLFTRIFIR